MADLVVEVLCEELPVSMIAPALAAFEDGLVGLLKGVPHAGTRAFSTPRRLAVVVEGLAAARPSETQLVTGPPLQAAQRDGAWTRAAEGFARGKGVTTDALQVVDGPRGQVVAVEVSTGGETVAELVSGGLDKLVLGLPFKKSMRWRDDVKAWGRPIRGVTVAYGGELVPCTVGGLDAVATVTGHRRSTLPPAPVSTADDYLAALRERWVEADRDVRRARVADGLAEVCAAEGVTLAEDEALLDEVTDLVEWPTVLAGRFDAELLELPARLLEESMKVHQRYFPSTVDGALSNVFLICSNNPTGDAATIALGNARVIRARFDDARFFFAEDRKLSLEEHGADLVKMRWVRGLGTVAEKQARLVALAPGLSEVTGGDPAKAARAAALCKCDLLSQMVGEFPELQGHIGRLYAAAAGEADEVALAVEEHYLPRFAGDDPPTTGEGLALALADRLDTLAGCFGIGLVPKGSADPQGLRRAAVGINVLLMERGTPQTLRPLLLAALSQHGDSLKRDADDVATDLVGFVLGRLRAMLAAEHRRDVVNAVFDALGDAPADADPVRLAARVRAVDAFSRSGEFADMMTAFKRVLNISKDHHEGLVEHPGTPEPASAALLEAVTSRQAAIDVATAELDYEAALGQMMTLKPAIDAFFDDVLVMDEDPAVRAFRLGLLRTIANAFLAVADFRRISE